MLIEQAHLLLMIEDRICRTQQAVNSAAMSVKLAEKYNGGDVSFRKRELDSAVELWINAVDRLAWLIDKGVINNAGNVKKLIDQPDEPDGLRDCYEGYFADLLAGFPTKGVPNVRRVMSRWRPQEEAPESTENIESVQEGEKKET